MATSDFMMEPDESFCTKALSEGFIWQIATA